MARFTTIVALVAPEATELVRAVERDATNVSSISAEDRRFDTAPERRRAAWADAERGRNVYTLTDFDPLEPLVDAWTRRLDGETHALDAAGALVETHTLPEYVLLDDAIDDSSVHWYLGLLRGYSPNRVVPVRPDPSAVVEALGHLRSGPAFPSPGELARAATEYVPTGITGSPEPAAVITPR